MEPVRHLPRTADGHGGGVRRKDPKEGFIMCHRKWKTACAAAFVAACLAGVKSAPSAAQETPPGASPNKLPPPQESAPPAAVRITLEEAKQRALANNKLL